MENYIAEVANILGVELDEIFEINDQKGHYYFDEKGLHQIEDTCNECSSTLHKLLTGRCNINRKPWKPSISDTYYYVNKHGDVLIKHWKDSTFDVASYKLGNCYPTLAEAADNREKWFSFYVLGENYFWKLGDEYTSRLLAE